MSDDALTLTGGVTVRSLMAAPVPHVTIAWHPDVRRVGDQVLVVGDALEISRNEGAFHVPRGGMTGTLADPFLSRTPLVLAQAGQRLRVTPSRKTVVNGRPLVAPQEFDLADGVRILLSGRVLLYVHLAVPRLGRIDPHGLIGASAGLDAVRDAIDQAARTPHAALVRGESGTGKELVARAIHEASGRTGAYNAVNMAAFPGTTAAAELFGHAKGAFTGATERRAGWFAKSEGGTLFMDEIGEASLALQALLLRALESGEIQPVGETATRRVDVRVVAATDAALEAAIAGGRFRKPLLHRLSAVQVRLPPLRERRDDIGRLLRHFLEQELDALGAGDRLRLPADVPPWLRADAVDQMLAHDWPGNIRELRNVARALALSGATAAQVDTRDLLPKVESAAPVQGQDQSVEAVYAIMQAAGWSASAAAKAMGVPKTTLYRLLERDSRVPKANEVTDAQVQAAYGNHGANVRAISDALRITQRSVRQRLRQLDLAY